jgi:hypothetical protein
MFENECTSVTNAERSGSPATATTTRNEERTLEMIRENRRITVGRGCRKAECDYAEK